MIKSGFFNAIKNNDGSYDRNYDSEDIGKYFKGAISENGIYKFVGNQCVVNAYSGMSVLVKNGKGSIKYHWFELDTDEAITINPSHPTLSRYTAVVARYDNSNRQIYLTTIDGEYEEIPSKPDIIRNNNIYDLCLAYVYVEAGTTEITIDKIEDIRDDMALCGYVKTLLDNGTGGIPKVDVLPAPQAEEVGNIYYLTTAYDDYKAGFYTCIKTITYNYKTITKIQGTIADRPDASFSYANQVYFATDENKYYVCKKNDLSVYEWQEITVNEVDVLPTASYDTLNNYYLDTVNDILYFGISNEDYTYILIFEYKSNIRIVTIPATGWTTETDGTKNYYTIEIDVEGMTAAFVGTSACDYVKPSPYNVAENEKRADLFSIIQAGNIESMDGKIKVIVNEIPSEPFDIRLFGV